MATVFLSVGSNINPEANLRTCASVLKQHFDQLKWSPVYRSEPVGISGADFLNAVISARTSLPVNEVVKILKQLETNQGRDRSMRGFKSRTLDLDLLLYDQLTIDTAELKLPHEDLTSAAFVLIPIIDLNAKGKHPTTGETYLQILEDCISRQADFATGLKKVPFEF